jgi:hypothetical protein
MSSQRRLLADFVKIYEIILNEYGLGQSHGFELTQLAHAQLYATQRQLAYLERRECSGAIARQRLRSLIRRWPLHLELYLDLAKTYIIPHQSQLQ